MIDSKQHIHLSNDSMGENERFKSAPGETPEVAPEKLERVAAFERLRSIMVRANRVVAGIQPGMSREERNQVRAQLIEVIDDTRSLVLNAMDATPAEWDQYWRSVVDE